MKKAIWMIGLVFIALIVLGTAYFFRASLFPNLSGPDGNVLLPFLAGDGGDNTPVLLPAVVGEQSTQTPGAAPSAAEKVAAPPAGEWAAMPNCAVDPLTPAEWDQFFTRSAAPQAAEALTMQRAAQLAPEAPLDTQGEQPQGAAPQPEPTAPEGDIYTALLMNVASGRLNRATEISLPEFPDIKTVGDLLDRLESSAVPAPAMAAEPAQGAPSLTSASQQILEGKGIVRPVCARLFVTQVGNLIDDVQWSASGMSERSVQAGAVTQTFKVIGEGMAAPNGEWAAFRSGGQDTGGPVFLLNLKTGEWKDLVEAMRATAADPVQLPEAYSWWDVIGWLPDSSRLVIGPADLPWVYMVDINTLDYQPIALQTFGLGGSDIVHLAPDGSKLVYVGNDATGVQQMATVDLATGQTAVLFSMPFSDGVIQQPSFSPDGKTVAYVVQKGQPQTGLTYAISLYSLEAGTSRVLVEGNLGATEPVWSPDGQHIAYTRKTKDEADIVSPDRAPEEPAGNIWAAAAADGKTWQVTFVSGQAAQPAWANDSKTLSFVSTQGQVGLVDITQPGMAWKAAEGDPTMPLFTSTFFLP